jgi:hypothetical protein
MTSEYSFGYFGNLNIERLTMSYDIKNLTLQELKDILSEEYVTSICGETLYSYFKCSNFDKCNFFVKIKNPQTNPEIVGFVICEHKSANKSSETKRILYNDIGDINEEQLIIIDSSIPNNDPYLMIHLICAKRTHGTTLIKLIEEFTQKSKFNWIALSSVEDVMVEAFYKKLGFKKIADQDSLGGIPMEKYLGEIPIKKKLGGSRRKKHSINNKK